LPDQLPGGKNSGAKKAGSPISVDISATRLSQGDPIGFPSHPCGWFSIFVYQIVPFINAQFKPKLASLHEALAGGVSQTITLQKRKPFPAK